jgi:hypothetical protein
MLQLIEDREIGKENEHDIDGYQEMREISIVSRLIGFIILHIGIVRFR